VSGDSPSEPADQLAAPEQAAGDRAA